jgi:serine/threonine-protein kinase HipA
MSSGRNSRFTSDLPTPNFVFSYGVGQRQEVGPGHRPGKTLNKFQPIFALRFSLAGVQLKFSAVMEASGGLSIPADGIGGSWIVKMPSARFPAVPENERAMLELARAVGINVPHNQLANIKGIHGLPEDAGCMEGNALAVERFDRAPGGKRIHMEDFAQVFAVFPDDKYDRRSYANIASVLWAETGQGQTYEFFRKQRETGAAT